MPRCSDVKLTIATNSAPTCRFDVRVLVPCYKENIEVVETTLKATLNADLPWNTTRTVYLCDDGNDPTKRELAEKLGPEVVYITGRMRQKGRQA